MVCMNTLIIVSSENDLAEVYSSCVCLLSDGVVG